jgi:DNA-binding NarL/FixJ family response regulator
MPTSEDPKHFTQAIQTVKRGCRVVDARRQGTLRDFHKPPERKLDILVGRALLTERERIGQVVSHAIRDPAVGEGRYE